MSKDVVQVLFENQFKAYHQFEKHSDYLHLDDWPSLKADLQSWNSSSSDLRCCTGLWVIFEGGWGGGGGGGGSHISKSLLILRKDITSIIVEQKHYNTVHFRAKKKLITRKIQKCNKQEMRKNSNKYVAGTRKRVHSHTSTRTAQTSKGWHHETCAYDSLLALSFEKNLTDWVFLLRLYIL